MNKFTVVTLVVLAFAGIASATTKAPCCTPEPITMLALIPGAAMLIRRRNNKA